ncbi:MAG: phosphatidylglycerol lysyltransferase domain-containing protein [Nitrospirae bacterium]|nr:phosphatidylglycerol lysyltransferase domain-containing protein [Nitrospirota bacterium]
MVIERLALGHKDLLYDRLKALGVQISEFSFPNAYLFREAHAYEVLRDREIFLKGLSYDGHTYLMPTTPLKDIDGEYLKSLAATVDFLFPVPEAWLPYFNEKDYEYHYREGDTDYIYTVDKMSTYPGRRLHKKRNLLKRFVGDYRHREMPLTKELKGEAISILNDWQAETGLDEDRTDFSPCVEALRLYEELVLCGGIYYADDEPAGFVVGEELDGETFVLHFAKARKKFKGVYQYMFNSFAKILPGKYRYLNFEQDLDSEPLRIAKSSYIPDRMVKKMRVSLKK